MKAAFYFLLGLMLGFNLRCTPRPAPLDASAPPPPSNPKVQLADDCPNACNKLREHNCPAGFQPDGGDTCEDICAQAVNSGYLYWPSTCIAQSETVEQIRACGVTCP